jgi:tetrahydromethanopterin S-methyltransferase subunit F
MFLRYVRESKWAFLWILLFPAVVFMSYWLLLDSYDELMPSGGLEDAAEVLDDYYVEEEEDELVDFLGLGLKEIKAFKYHNGIKIIGAGMIFSVVLNLILLLVVPCLGSANEKEKKKEFLAGFSFNLLLVLALPVLCMRFAAYPDIEIFGLLLALGVFGFLAPFLVGSRFVSEAYKNAFWFYTKILSDGGR